MTDELMKTGIPGFDEILGGGFPVPHSCIILGGPGTGKSIFGMQFIVEGAKQFNEKGVYITLEETAESLRHAAASLGMDLSGLEKSGLLKIVEDPEVKSSARLAEFIQKYVDEVGAKRVVLDSLSIYRDIQGTDEKSTRGEILRLVNKMRALNIVLLVTAERGFSTIDDIYYLADDHLFQGVIMLMKLRSRATFERCICIVKVRGIDHSLRVHPLKISRGGITIYPDSTPFSLKAGGMDEQGNLG